jgi:hypothetical protein
MDETGIHEEATMVAVGGYISRPKHWRAWTKDWNRAKRPIKIFHSSDCANLRGEFESWDKKRRDAYVAQLLPIMPVVAARLWLVAGCWALALWALAADLWTLLARVAASRDRLKS